jgi:hypothetical protein
MKSQSIRKGIDRHTRVKFDFEQGNVQENIYRRDAQSIIRKLDKLFPTSPSLIHVHVFYQRRSFLGAIHKKKAPDWLVAYIFSNDTSHIHLFGEVIQHRIFLHEVTHLYTNTLNSNLPDWLKERVSVYIAEQIYQSHISRINWKKVAPRGIPFQGVSWGVAAEHDGYPIAGLLVLFFVRRYGWKKFIAAIRLYHDQKCFFLKWIADYFDEESEQILADFRREFVK